MEWRSRRKRELADEGVWGREGEVSLRREEAEEGDASCSPFSVLTFVIIEPKEDDAKDEADDALWAWWTARGGSTVWTV